jgi:hypothetical protein
VFLFVPPPKAPQDCFKLKRLLVPISALWYDNKDARLQISAPRMSCLRRKVRIWLSQ